MGGQGSPPVWSRQSGLRSHSQAARGGDRTSQDSQGLPARALSSLLYNPQRIVQRILTVSSDCRLTLQASCPNGGSECLVTCPWSPGKHTERTGLAPRSLGSKYSVYSTPVSRLSPCLSPLISFFIFFYRILIQCLVIHRLSPLKFNACLTQTAFFCPRCFEAPGALVRNAEGSAEQGAMAAHVHSVVAVLERAL